MKESTFVCLGIYSTGNLVEHGHPTQVAQLHAIPGAPRSDRTR